MIIVRQDKKEMVNFDKVESIDICADLDGTGEVPYEISYETNSKRDSLGKYKTEERAKEVLQDIINTFGIKEINNARYEFADLVIKMRRFVVYEMPAE